MSRPVRDPAALLSTGPQSQHTGIVVSPHVRASQAGISILERGGNAIDAAIAVDAVLSVVAPDTCGPGGDLFALIHEPGSLVPTALNASGRAGSGISADELRDAGYGEIPYRSPWSITVPGCVDGWESLVDRYAKFSLAECLAPAISIAREGFNVSLELASSLDVLTDLIAEQGSSRSMYPAGEPARVGTQIARTDLADTLEAIASGGREAFYCGNVGTEITTATQGAVTPDDLEVAQAEWVSPASIDIFDTTAWTIGANTQGYLTLATLWIFEHLDPPKDANDPLFHHLLIEAYRSVAWERGIYVSEPATAPVTNDELLNVDRLSVRAASIDRSRATRWPMPVSAPGGTAYLTARDGSGMGVSFIQSNFAGIGSGLSAGETGVFLHNRGAGFNLIPGHPNEYTPGNRPLHTLSPTLWTKGTGLELLLGTRGGDQQPQFLAQYAAHHFHAGACTDDSQMEPRWNMEQPRPGTDSALRIEPRFNPKTRAALESMGHDIEDAAAWEPGWGPISAIDVGGEMKGSADPRISTSAALHT
ncbi:MAG: gamma-glutamyltransferase family protein [Actinomycetia bacterium]|nr:gamma-glutamyltransferase family protein [Actinomycetes bacterium]